MNRITITHTLLSELKVIVILESGLAAPSVSTICTVIMSLSTWVLLQCQERIIHVYYVLLQCTYMQSTMQERLCK